MSDWLTGRPWHRPVVVVLCAVLVVMLAAEPVVASGVAGYRHHLARGFHKVERRDTRFIIVHSTESGLSSALYTLSRGGKAHYLVARSGRVYPIVPHPYRANHAGCSVWDGITHLSDHSLGIELEGYATRPFTAAQYRSLKALLEELQQTYRIPDQRVLEHYRVAYSRPNVWNRQPRRGRKRDPGVDNFSRVLAGLTNPEPQVDPDVAAGRILPDPEVRLAQLEWRKRGMPARAEGRVVRSSGPSPSVLDVAGGEYNQPPAPPAPAARPAQPEQQKQGMLARAELTIGSTQSAWNVAGGAYDQPTTIYTFPGGRRLRGDQIRNWSRIPKGTRVSQAPPAAEAAATATATATATAGAVAVAAVATVTKERTPWQIARGDYDSPTTHYTFPDGCTVRGDQVRDWSRIPLGTRVVVGSPAS